MFFFWKTIMWLAQAMIFKCLELVRDTADWKMIKDKILPKYSQGKKIKEEKKGMKEKKTKGKHNCVKIIRIR